MKFIKDLKEGEFVTSQAQVRKKQIRLKRNKEPYLWMVLSDRSGRIDAKMWDRVQGPGQEIQEGDFVHYQGNVQTYNGSRQLIVEEVRKLDFEGDRQAVNVQDLIPCSQYDVEEMWQRLRSLLVEHTRRPCVLRLLERILDRYEQQVKTYPAAIEIHHGYWGGFLEHVLSVLKGALFFAGKYPGLDRDLLIAGSVLHDIGKLEELSGPYRPSFTAQGQLIGHVVLGCHLVRSETSQISDFPADLSLLLEHVVLSHQGQPDWGSPKQPKIPEALILHYLDDLDAKINRFAQVIREDPGDSDFTQYDRYLGRVVFKANYEEHPNPSLVATQSE